MSQILSTLDLKMTTSKKWKVQKSRMQSKWLRRMIREEPLPPGMKVLIRKKKIKDKLMESLISIPWWGMSRCNWAIKVLIYRKMIRWMVRLGQSLGKSWSALSVSLLSYVCFCSFKKMITHRETLSWQINWRVLVFIRNFSKRKVKTFSHNRKKLSSALSQTHHQRKRTK